MRSTAYWRFYLWFVHIQYGEFASIFKLMGLDMPPDAAEDSVSFVGEEYAADVMEHILTENLAAPEGVLPDWTRLTPGGGGQPRWYYRKKDESQGREWIK